MRGCSPSSTAADSVYNDDSVRCASFAICVCSFRCMGVIHIVWICIHGEYVLADRVAKF